MMTIFFIVLLISQSLHSNSLRPRPNVEDSAAFARWLIAAADWGVVCTNNMTAPFANVVSYSDGATGFPYFYLTIIEPTANLARIDPRASFTVSEAELGDCAGKDPQSPLCSKITLSGELVKLEQSSDEGKFGKEAFFRRHPNFDDNIFPGLDRTFSVFKLIPSTIFLVNKAAPPATPSVADYFAVNGTI